MKQCELEQILDGLTIVTQIVNAEEKLIKVQAQFADEKIKSKQYLDKAHIRFLELQRIKTIVEALIDTGNVLADEHMSGLHNAFGNKWHDLVEEYRVIRK